MSLVGDNIDLIKIVLEIVLNVAIFMIRVKLVFVVMEIIILRLS